jgi:hypothetical protein
MTSVLLANAVLALIAVTALACVISLPLCLLTSEPTPSAQPATDRRDDALLPKIAA